MGGYHYPGTHGRARSDGVNKGTHTQATVPGPIGGSDAHIYPHHHSPYEHHDGDHEPLLSAAHFGISDRGIALLKGIEALFLKPYDDQTEKEISAWVKGATIGYGHLIPRAEWDTYKGGITEPNALKLLLSELQPFSKLVANTILVPVTQKQFDALVLLSFNIGESGFSSSSVVKMINDPSAKGDFIRLEDAWKSWNKSQGKVMKGLDRRRAAEWDIYTKGIYKKW